MSFDSETPARVPARDTDLTTVDWVIAILCSGIGCIIGIVRLIQGKPNAGKMIGVSVLFMVLWGILRYVIQLAQQGGVQ